MTPGSYDSVMVNLSYNRSHHNNHQKLSENLQYFPQHKMLFVSL